MAPFKVGLHDDNSHVSLGELQNPQGIKRYSMTEAHETIKHIKEIKGPAANKMWLLAMVHLSELSIVIHPV